MLVGLLFGSTGRAGAEAEPAPPRQELVAAVHVHSTASTGGLSLEDVASQAERLGLDAVLLSDNFVLQFEYGLPPFRRLMRYGISLPSVVDYGIARYLQEVADVQARHPGLLLMPGIEVAPHYFWTGSLFDGSLTMHNAQRNLLVLGLTKAEDYLDLPVSGHTAAYSFSGAGLQAAVPVVLFILAVWLWRDTRPEPLRAAGLKAVALWRGRVLGGLVGVLALAMFIQGWPFSHPLYSSYKPDLGYQPYQTVIDMVGSRGGITIWSMPEARDFSRHRFGPLGPVTITTEPYPEALLHTVGYDGFGGVYQDNRTAIRPGGEWDQSVDEFLSGHRARPPRLIGELAFHGPGHDEKNLTDVLTVAWVKERSVPALVDALGAGKVYGVERYQKDFRLQLEAFYLEDSLGERRGEMGDVVQWEGLGPPAVRLKISASDGGTYPIRVEIVRAGEVLAEVQGETPVDARIVETRWVEDRPVAYRVAARGAGELLSNPIFVNPQLRDG
ncbi:MAG: hypothetical protein ACREI3_07545 [Nitrospirales bacterium]